MFLMGIPEIIIVGLVVFFVVFFIVKFLNTPRSSDSNPINSSQLLIGSVLGVLGLMSVAAVMLYLSLHRIESHQGTAVTHSTLTAPAHQNEIDESAGTLTSVTYQDHRGTNVVSPASVVQVNHTILVPGIFLIVLFAFIFTLVAVVRGSRIAKFAMVSLMILLAVLVGGTWTLRSENQTTNRLQEQSATTIATQNNAIAARNGELENKPPIFVEKPSPGAPVDINVPTKVTEIVYRENGYTQSDIDRLPEWTLEPVQTESNGRVAQVFSSGRFATLQEAEQQLRPVIKSFVRMQLAKEHPEMSDWDFDQHELQGLVIKKRCEVTYPLEVGGFTEAVHQLHWELELDKTSKERLYAMWQPVELKRRLTYLGIGLGTVTALLGAGAFVTRRKEE